MGIMIHLLFSITLSAVITLINVGDFGTGSLTVVNLIATSAYLIAWFFYGLVMGKSRSRTFIPFAFCFWIVGIVLGVVYSFIQWNMLADVLIWVYRIPVYGVEHFIYDVPLHEIASILLDYLIIFALPLSVSLLGFSLKGKNKKAINSNI